VSRLIDSEAVFDRLEFDCRPIRSGSVETLVNDGIKIFFVERPDIIKAHGKAEVRKIFARHQQSLNALHFNLTEMLQDRSQEWF